MYKYLTPKSVIVTQGLHVHETEIKLRINYITMMQLLDVAEHISLHDKMCGTNKIYLAPEINEHTHRSQITKKADVWSTGVILYVLVIGKCTLDMVT